MPLAAWLALSGAAWCLTPPDPTTHARLLADYGPHHDRLTAHLWQNVQVAGDRVVYDHLVYGGRGPKLCRDKFTAVADAKTLVYQVTSSEVNPNPITKPPPGAVYESAGVVTPDAAYQIGLSPGKPTVCAPIMPWDKRSGPDYYYGHHYEWDAGLAWPLYFSYIERGPNRYYPMHSGRLRFRLVTVTCGVYRGYLVRSVWHDGAADRGNSNRPARHVAHFRAADWLLAGRQKYWHPGGTPVTGPPPAGDLAEVIDIDYGPPAADTGLPFPVRVRGFAFGPAGSRTPIEDVTFTVYRRHAPTPAELDAEARFGVTLPPPGPRPPLPPAGEFLPDPDARPTPRDETPAADPPAARMWWLIGGAVAFNALLVAAAVGLGPKRAKRK